MPADRSSLESLSPTATRLLPYAVLTALGTFCLLVAATDIWQYGTGNRYATDVFDYLPALVFLTIGWLSTFAGLGGVADARRERSNRDELDA